MIHGLYLFEILSINYIKVIIISSAGADLVLVSGMR